MKRNIGIEIGPSSDLNYVDLKIPAIESKEYVLLIDPSFFEFDDHLNGNPNISLQQFLLKSLNSSSNRSET